MTYITKAGVVRIMDELDGMFDIHSEEAIDVVEKWESAF